MQLHRRADESLQQRVVQLLRDASAFGEPLVEAAGSAAWRPAAHGNGTAPTRRPRPADRRQRWNGDASARSCGLDLEAHHGFVAVPAAIAVGGRHAEDIVPRAEIRVDRLALGDRLAPVAVETVETIAEADPLGNGQAEAGIGERDAAVGPAGTTRDSRRDRAARRRPTGSSTCDDRRRRARRRGRDRSIDSPRLSATRCGPSASATTLRCRFTPSMDISPSATAELTHGRPRRRRRRRPARRDRRAHPVGRGDPQPPRRSSAMPSTEPRSTPVARRVRARGPPCSTARPDRRADPHRSRALSSNSALTSFEGSPSRVAYRRQPPVDRC